MSALSTTFSLWRKFSLLGVGLLTVIMAWRSHGVNNADMIRNLRGKNHLFVKIKLYINVSGKLKNVLSM